MGRVFIIGAGPGDPGLITARGVRLLSESDVVVYDRAVEPVLRWARPDAERIAAGAPAERETAQDAISMLLAEKARDGYTVARLKWGDPFVFDSGGKEALFLHEQGIEFEVVPGVPSAIGASAYAGIPVTYPGAGDAFLLLRGQESEGSDLPNLDWRAVAAIDGTIACFAGPRLVPALLQRLLDHGAAPDRAASLVFRGTLPGQRTMVGTIASLHASFSATPPPEPALLIVGEVVGLRNHLRWFDERPLFGRRIVVTRSAEQAPEIVDALEALGAQAIMAPTFRTEPPDDPEAVDRAAASVDVYNWVIFESAGAVTRFLAALRRGPRDLRALGRVHLCAVGPSTADRLTAAGLTPDVIVAEVGPDRAALGLEQYTPMDGQRVLVVRPDHIHGSVAADLEHLGATVTDLVAYRTAPASPDSPGAQQIYRMLLEGQVDAVTFNSPTALRRFAVLIGEEQAADLLNTTVVVAIGPVTAAAAISLGVTSPLVAKTFTTRGVIDALLDRFERR